VIALVKRFLPAFRPSGSPLEIIIWRPAKRIKKKAITPAMPIAQPRKNAISLVVLSTGMQPMAV